MAPLLKGASLESVRGVEVDKVERLDQAVKEIVNGAAFFMKKDADFGFLFSASRFLARAIPQATKEMTIKGPDESFTENLHDNVSLFRKWIRNEKLVVEQVVANQQKTEKATMLYLKDVTNEQLLQQVRDRLAAIPSEYIQSVEVLEQLLEDRQLSLFPSILYTVKPDRAVSYLMEGHIVLLHGASSGCLVLPATFWSLYHAGDDHYLLFTNGNFSRLIRIFGFFITLLTSALYIAFTNFHHEMLPPDLLLAIAATRERVPFPVVIELLIMEFFFELIREAGLRIPAPLGPTIGIVGALILGQAAVQANIISPLIIIIVALSGLASFTIVNTGLNYGIRILRFLFIIVSSTFGIIGLALLFTVSLIYLSSLKSFGVPYLSPMTPHYPSSSDTVFRQPSKFERIRPTFVAPKKRNR